MKIIIDVSGYPLRNVGDSAMLQVAVMRLQQLCPEATIQVFTTAPDKLAELCPNVQPLSPVGRQLWISPLVDRVHQLMPNRRAKQFWTEVEWRFRRNSPALVRAYLGKKLRMKLPEHVDEFEKFMDAIHSADLVIASGGGYITDVFKRHAMSVMSTLELAMALNKPTVLLGQGLGPLRDVELLTRTKTILPMVNLIALREQRVGVPLLNSLKVSPERVVVTGDDAIELAYNARPDDLGNGIGINLRVAKYSAIDSSLLSIVGSTLQEVASLCNAELLPVPISGFSKDRELSDSMAIQKLLAGYDNTSDGGQLLDTPMKVIQQVGCCRVVVTGSYHAGVFALSQGIPVVGLAKSEYYADKFLGLADQFGTGCKVVLLNDLDLGANLLSTIRDTWQAAEQLRPRLLDAAAKQMEMGRSAYRQIYFSV